MEKKEQTKNSPSYSVGQEIVFGGHRGGISTATILKVGRRYCTLSSKRLRLDMQLNKVVSAEGDWTYPIWASKEEYELELKSNELWEEIKNQFNRPYSRPVGMTLDILGRIKSILDEIQ